MQKNDAEIEELLRLSAMHVLAHRRTKEHVPVQATNLKSQTREFAITLMQSMQGNMDRLHELAHTILPRGIDELTQAEFVAFFEQWIQWFNKLKSGPRILPPPPQEVVDRGKAYTVIEGTDNSMPPPTEINPQLKFKSQSQVGKDLPPLLPAGADKLQSTARVFALAQWRKEQTAALKAYHIDFGTREQTRRNLELLFYAIDHSNKKSIPFGEVINYLLDASVQGRLGAKPAAIKPYFSLPVSHTLRHLEGVRQFKYIPEQECAVIASHCHYQYLNPVTFRPCSIGRCSSVQLEGVLELEYIPVLGQIVVSSPQLRLSFFEMRTGRLLQEHKVESSQVCLKYDMHWQRLFTGSRSGELLTWEIREGLKKHRLLHVGNSHAQPVTAILVLPGHSGVATCSLDASIVIHEPETGAIIQRYTPGGISGIHSMAYSTEYNLLVTGGLSLASYQGFEAYPFVWLINGSDNVRPFPLVDDDRPHTNALVGVLAIDGTPQIISLDSGGTLKVWDIRNFSCVQTIKCERHITKKMAQQFPWHMLSYCPLTKSLVCSTRRCVYAFQYNPDSNGVPTVAEDHPICALTYNAFSRTILTAGGCSISVWDAATGALSTRYDTVSPEPITSLCTDAQGKRFFIGTLDGCVQSHNYSNAQRISQFKVFPAEVTAILHCTPQHAQATEFLLVCDWNGAVRLLKGNARKLHKLHAYFDADLDIVSTIDAKCFCFDPWTNILIIGDTANLCTVVQLASDRHFKMKIAGRLINPEMKDVLHVANQEVTTVALLAWGAVGSSGSQHYCGYVSAETNGRIEVNTCRPHPFPDRCVARWMNATPRDHHFPGAVICLLYHGPSRCLLAGDDLGFVGVWELAPLLDKYFATEKYQGLTLGDVLIGMPPEGKRVPEEQSEPSEPLSSMALRTIWRAHTMAVRSIAIVDIAADTIVTASDDRHAILWTIQGEQIGRLDQTETGLYNLLAGTPVTAKKEPHRNVTADYNCRPITNRDNEGSRPPPQTDGRQAESPTSTIPHSLDHELDSPRSQGAHECVERKVVVEPAAVVFAVQSEVQSARGSEEEDLEIDVNSPRFVPPSPLAMSHSDSGYFLRAAAHRHYEQEAKNALLARDRPPVRVALNRSAAAVPNPASRLSPALPRISPLEKRKEELIKDEPTREYQTYFNIVTRPQAFVDPRDAPNRIFTEERRHFAAKPAPAPKPAARTPSRKRVAEHLALLPGRYNFPFPTPARNAR